jgi:hypothetical protein
VSVVPCMVVVAPSLPASMGMAMRLPTIMCVELDVL